MVGTLDNPELETWQEEGFKDFAEYQAYYCALADDLYVESKQAWKQTKQRWMNADQRVELTAEKSGQLPKRPASSDIPIVPAAVEEAIALRIESLPRPSAQSRQPNEDEMVSALNYWMNQEFDMASFDVLMARVALDMIRFGIGCIKQTIDREATGPFGQTGRINFTKVDPRHIWPDPFATSHNWQDMRYLLVAVPQDLEDIRKWFPVRGPLVKADPSYSLSREESDDNDSSGSNLDYFTTFKDKNGTFTVGERRRALVKECWLKDGRKKEYPKEDKDGNYLYNEDGSLQMEERPCYPNGRVIITCGDVVLLDVANPYRHKQPPYTFFPARVSSKFFTYGDVELLAKIEDKVNVLMRDLQRNARTNMNSPWLVDSGAFDSPEKYKNLTNDEGLVIIARPNARVQRVPPGEVPQFIAPLIDRLTGYFDNILGIGGVMRGQLTEGAQLSAEAVSTLQGASGTRLRLKSRLFETAMEHCGYLLQWNIRQTYPSKMEVKIIDPSSGEPRTIEWNDDKAQDDYPISIEVGSSLPGAKQGASAMAIQLWNQDLIDRQKAIEMLNIPGGAVMLKRMEDRATQLAELGFEADIKKNKTGAPGRKVQEVRT